MKCAELDKKMRLQSRNPSIEMLEHISHCKLCEKKYTVGTVLARRSVSEDSNLVTGEGEFFQRLEKLSTNQTNAFLRADALNERVIEGDRLFWSGDYDGAFQSYNDALMLVKDREGRAAIFNKLARTQIHRHYVKDAIDKLYDGLLVLGESIPSNNSFVLNLSIFVELFRVWATMFIIFVRRLFPELFHTKTHYGDRSKAAQHLYRELSILSQGYDEHCSKWAHLREMYWAIRLEQPLELVVTWGRHATQEAINGHKKATSYWLKKIEKFIDHSELFVQATALFYLGRTAFLLGNWEKSLDYLERSEKICLTIKDERLREATLQHLMRVYRNLEKFSEAIRVADELLSLYYKLGNLPRLSACCRYFSIIYVSSGDLRKAKLWAAKALEVAEGGNQNNKGNEDVMLSILRCYILLADLEIRSGQSQRARHFLSGAIRIKRLHQLPFEYFSDAIVLLRRVLGMEQKSHFGIFAWLRENVLLRWAIFRGDFEKLHQLHNDSSLFSNKANNGDELSYIYDAYLSESHKPGVHESIPTSKFARAFLSGELVCEKLDLIQDLNLITSMFSVGAVSSRWGKSPTAKRSACLTTAQFSDCSESPWGYFFANDIG